MRFRHSSDTGSGAMPDRHYFLLIVGGAAAFTIAIVTSLAIVLSRNFMTIACDSAVIQSGIVNTIHGHWFSIDGPGGPNILGSHSTFLLLAMIPLYEALPSIETLLVAQVCIVYLTIVPLYLIAHEITRKPVIALCVAAAALGSPYLLHMALAPVHFETWIASAVLWSYFAYLRKHRAGFVAAMLVALCAGEQAGLIYIALGVSLLAIDDGRPWRKPFGLLSAATGLGWILLEVVVIGPAARGSSHFNIFAYNYAEWHVTSVAGLPAAVAGHPRMALRLLFDVARWQHLFFFLGVPLVLAFLSWRSFLLLLPVPAYLLMSGQEFFLPFHAYYFTFAFVAGYLGLIFLLARPDLKDRIALVAIFATLLVNGFLLCIAADNYLPLIGCADPESSQSLRDIFEKIPPGAGVYSPHRYSAYLSNREYLVIGDLRAPQTDFDAMLEAEFPDTHVHAGQIDFIVCDYLNDQCGPRIGLVDPIAFQSRKQNIDTLVNSGRWRSFWQKDNVAILQRVPKG